MTFGNTRDVWDGYTTGFAITLLFAPALIGMDVGSLETQVDCEIIVQTSSVRY